MEFGQRLEKQYWFNDMDDDNDNGQPSGRMRTEASARDIYTEYI